ncbi:unnamed protein product, partial [Ectocarpus fasciculatus]
SLFGSSALDRRIKGTLMADIFHLVGFRPFDRMALRREERREAKHIPGTRRAVRAVAGRPQDAWRRCQTPASINLGELGEEEWEVIRDTEDEQARALCMCHGGGPCGRCPSHRAGHFRVLYLTAENVTRLWPIFRSPRFFNGVLARWVLTGGLSNPSNRQNIGLIAERLATLGKSQGGKGLSSTSSGMIAGGAGGGGIKGPKGKGRGLWEETTSNATTVVTTTRGGGGARLGDELSGSSPWSGSAGERPASSATSRASRPSAARRPPCRASEEAAVPLTATAAKVAAAAAAAAAGGTQQQMHRQHGSKQHLSSEGRGGGGRVDGRRADKVVAAPGGGGGGGGRGAEAGRNLVGGGAEKPSRVVPRLQLHRAESRLALAPSLLTLRTPVVLSSSRRGVGAAALSGGGSREGGSGVAPRRRRASSASSSRPPSTHRLDGSGTSRGGDLSGSSGAPPPPVVSLEVKPLGFISALSTGERWEPQVAALPAPSLCLPGAEVARKTNATPRRRSLQQQQQQHHHHHHHHHHQDREQVFAISNSRVPGLPDGCRGD